MNEIQEYNGVEAALSEFKARYADRVYDVTTRDGMADAKVARREIRTARTGLEKLRKELKEPALRRCQAIDSEAKRLTQALVAIEDPIDTLIKAEEERVEQEKAEAARQEQLRVAKIRERIEMFNVMPPWGAKSTDIRARLREVSDIPIDESFAEFTEAAAIAKAQAITRLSTMASEAAELEDEQERLKKVAEETEARMSAERAENERKLAEERAKADAERQERIEAQRKLDEAAAQERERLAVEAREAREAQAKAENEALAEKRRLYAEAVEQERLRVLAEAKRDSAEAVLDDIRAVVTLCLSDQMDNLEAIDRIATILEANK